MALFKTWTDYHNRINLIFHAIAAISMLPFIWLYLEIDTQQHEALLTDGAIVGLFVLICASILFTARMYKKKSLAEVKPDVSLRNKLEKYQQILLANYALLEGSAVIATLGFYLSANYLFAVIYVFILFVFSLDRPHIDRACRDLKLSGEEKDILIGRTEID